MSEGLAVTRLGYRYPVAEDPALRDVTLTVAPGEVLAVVGPSGSGKTTLLRVLAGLVVPDEGTVRIGGTDITTTPPERRPVAMVFQGFALFPHLSVRDNIGFGLRVRRTPRVARATRVAEAAARLGLAALLDRLPGQLSGGERQRVALARALVRDPAVFCLDEPLSSLDPVLRTTARRDLDDLLRREGRCAVYVTHDQAEALTMGDAVAVLRDGAVEQVGTPREIYERPATVFVAGFVGTPPMSVVPAGVLRVDPRGAAMLGIRAEHVRLDPAGDDAEILGVDDVGHELHVAVAMDGVRLVARVPPSLAFRPGDRVGVLADTDAVRRFDADGRAL